MNSSLAEKIVYAISLVVGEGPAKLHEPQFSGNEYRYLEECLESTNVASEGRFIPQFESDLAAFTQARHVISVSSGTAALHIALLLAGVEKNDEVLVPDLSFIATANAVAYCNAVPHFVDVEDRNFGIDAPKLQDYLKIHTRQENGVCINRATKRRIKVVLPMHAFGHPVNMGELVEVAANFNLVIIEDAAEAIGSMYGCRHAGTIGLAGVLSFNGNKIITTGGGGAILTNDEEFASRARHITKTAKVSHPWEYIHDQIGYNYRLPNLNAALGCAQLEQLPELLRQKRALFSAYEEAFTSVKMVKLLSEPTNCRSNYWLQTLLLDNDVAAERSDVLGYANKLGYMIRPAWQSLSESKPYRTAPCMEDMRSQQLIRRLINLPSNHKARMHGP